MPLLWLRRVCLSNPFELKCTDSTKSNLCLDPMVQLFKSSSLREPKDKINQCSQDDYVKWLSSYQHGLKKVIWIVWSKPFVSDPIMRIFYSFNRMIQYLFPKNPELRGRRVVTFHNQRDYIFFRHHRYMFEAKETKSTHSKNKSMDSTGEKGFRYCQCPAPVVYFQFSCSFSPFSFSCGCVAAIVASVCLKNYCCQVYHTVNEVLNQSLVYFAMQECGPRFVLKLISLQHGTFDPQGGEFEWNHKPEMDTSRRRFFL